MRGVARRKKAALVLPEPDLPMGPPGPMGGPMGLGPPPTAGEPGSMMRPGLSCASLCAVDSVDLSRMKLSSEVLAWTNLPYFL